MSAYQDSIHRLGFRSEVLDIGVARNSAAHRLPVGDDHRWAFNNRARPTQFLRSLNLKAGGVEGDSARLNLLDGHTAILRLLAIFVGEFDEMDEIRVEKRDSTSSRVQCPLPAEVEAIPVEEVEQSCDGQKGGPALGPLGRRLVFRFDDFGHRSLSTQKGLIDNERLNSNCQMVVDDLTRISS